MSYVKKTSTEPPLVQSSEGAPHIINHTALFPPFPASPGGTRTRYFSIRLLPVESPQAVILFDWASTTSLNTSLRQQFPSTCNLPTHLHLQYLKIEGKLESSQTSTVELFAETFNNLRPLAIFAEALHRGCLTGF